MLPDAWRFWAGWLNDNASVALQRAVATVNGDDLEGAGGQHLPKEAREGGGDVFQRAVRRNNDRQPRCRRPGALGVEQM